MLVVFYHSAMYGLVFFTCLLNKIVNANWKQTIIDYSQQIPFTVLKSISDKMI